ncbi:MAG: hypothetical protein IPG76_18435 [Acidobacteria bacterium]|nr:hypothetical protein [Acidobacteriota bacterium]
MAGERLEEAFNNRVRETVVFAQSDEFELADSPIKELLINTSIINLENPLPADAKLSKGRKICVTGLNDTNCNVGEIAVLSSRIETNKPTFILELESKLKNEYRRNSVRIYPNIAFSTHGETKTEILGSGDGSKLFQFFQAQSKASHLC